MDIYSVHVLKLQYRVSKHGHCISMPGNIGQAYVCDLLWSPVVAIYVTPYICDPLFYM